MQGVAAVTALMEPAQPDEGQESGYWLATRRLTLLLLMLWFGVTLLAAFFARELDFMLFGWPFGFWFGAQGALLLFLGIVAVYIWGMERLEAGATSEH